MIFTILFFYLLIGVAVNISLLIFGAYDYTDEEPDDFEEFVLYTIVWPMVAYEVGSEIYAMHKHIKRNTVYDRVRQEIDERQSAQEETKPSTEEPKAKSKPSLDNLTDNPLE